MVEKGTCLFCARAVVDDSDYCSHHNAANEKLQEGYEAWKKALGELTWERYLESILGLQETGDWVKQVANKHLDRIRRKEIGTGHD